MTSLFKDPAKRAAWIFNCEMKPCPKCGGYDLHHQTPIKQEPILATDGARQILGKWARAVKDGHTPLEGPVFIMCFACGHCGPSMDCTGRTSEDVGQDPVVSKEVKRLWNNQAP